MITIDTRGGGAIHFCGTAIHQLENFLLTDGLTGINNFCMANFEKIFKMQELFENKIALMVCDFAPLDFDSYIGALFKKLKSKGTIIAMHIPSCFVLNDGTYSIIKRDAHQIASDLYIKLAQIKKNVNKDFINN